VEEALKDIEYPVVADPDAAEVLEPGVGALDFPSPPVTSQLTFVLEAAVPDVAAVGNDQLRALLLEPQAERVGVITAVGDHTAQTGTRTPTATATARHSHRGERAFRQAVLRDLRGRKLRSDRYAAAVDHHHALRTLPATGLADCGAPFFRGDEGRIQKRFLPVQELALVQFPQQFASGGQPDTLLFPHPQPPPAGGLVRHIAPSGSRAESTGCLPGKPDWTPRDGLVHPCDA
jgi:hypothetical protein